MLQIVFTKILYKNILINHKRKRKIKIIIILKKDKKINAVNSKIKL